MEVLLLNCYNYKHWVASQKYVVLSKGQSINVKKSINILGLVYEQQ